MALLRTVLVILIAATALTSVTLFLTTPIDVTPLLPEDIQPIATTTAVAADAPAAALQETVAETTPIASVPAQNNTAEQEPAEPEQPAGLSDAALNASARGALVNLFCLAKSGGANKPLSGSGVVIDSRGVILTNAHIAQYFLLAKSKRVTPITCTVRTGSPAKNTYEAELLYVSPEWIADNAAQINSSKAKGTGKNDYALLMVTNTMDGSPPGTLAYLPYAGKTPKVGERILLSAYPAGFLSGETIAEALYPTSAFTYVTKLYTFDNPKNTDLFSVGGSVVSQAGASGGAAVRADGSLAGIIATALLDGDTAERDLRAITVAHIERSLAAAGKGSLATLLTGNLYTIADDFADDVAPALIKQLEDGLDD